MLKARCLVPWVLSLGVATIVCDASANAQSGPWDRFVTKAAETYGEFGSRAAQFLRDNAPERDAQIDPALLDENLQLALAARERFRWAEQVDEALFFDAVLPYAVLDETRERWRPMLLELGSEIVSGCENAADAAQALNRELFNRIEVHYNTGRKRPNQSPSESIAQGRATCTGLSILLVDACRAVGIPARVAGVASWHDKRGNHTWVEIHDGERWRFTGADEYDAKGLDRGWFTNDASKAKRGERRYAVWASAWAKRPGGESFPMVWNSRDESVPGVDVTARYAKKSESENASEVTRFLRVWDQRGGERLALKVVCAQTDGSEPFEVETRAGRSDLNDMPALQLEAGKTVRLIARNEGVDRSAYLTIDTDASGTIELYWNEMSLDRSAAEKKVAELFAQRAAAIAESTKSEVEEKAFTSGDKKLRILEKVFGEAEDGKRSLWISMHGGGGAPARVNDQQWKNQIRLYTLEEGIYIAPRAPTNTWNLWHEGHIDTLFDRLIDTYVSTRGVDPDRVYLLGYSAGGDGVYQLAPRMADRFAAASMMAGHPNDASPLGLRNLPFAIFMGGADKAYKRNEVAAEWGKKLDALQEKDPEGYVHRTTIYEGLPHWMNGKDKEALPWMAGYTRNPWPKKVVWRQSNRTHTRFYWLQVEESAAKGGQLVTAEVDGQEIRVAADGLEKLTLRLRDELIDLDQPIVVKVGEKTVFEGRVERSEQAIRDSLAERNDPRSAATASLTISL